MPKVLAKSAKVLPSKQRLDGCQFGIRAGILGESRLEARSTGREWQAGRQAEVLLLCLVVWQGYYAAQRCFRAVQCCLKSILNR